MMKKLRDNTIILIITVVLLLGIELGSFLILKMKGLPASFFLAEKENKIGPAHGFWQLTAFDPTLGYAPDYLEMDKTISRNEKKLIPGFVRYGLESGKSNLIRIVILGGSTTDGTIMPYSWPEDLYSILKDNRYNAVIYNGGVVGFSSSQEVFKLIRDVVQLKPDIVISLNGINEISTLHSIENHPYINPYQKSIFESLSRSAEKSIPIMNSTYLLVKKILIKATILPKPRYVYYGNPDKSNKVAIWFRNIRIMNTTSKEFGFRYYCFLQPTMGVGIYQISEDEKKMLNATYYPDLLKDLNSFYKEAIENCRTKNFCYNLIDIFKNDKKMYRDFRHQNHAGTLKLANEIFKIIQRRDLLHFNG